MHSSRKENRMINIYETQTMIAAMNIIGPKPTFLRDRYFPTSDKDIFVTEKVLVEYKDESKRKMAPCVVPYKGGIAIARDGYYTDQLTPANVAPKRVLTITDLKKKQFGETLFSTNTPEQREASLLQSDLIDLDESISTREEWMAAQVLFNNGYTMRHYVDEYGTAARGEDYVINFYDGSDNKAKYTADDFYIDNTEAQGKAFIKHLGVMVAMLKDRGLNATDLIIGRDVARVMQSNDYIIKLMDLKNYTPVLLDPTELPSGATLYGTINVEGTVLNILSYGASYVTDANKNETFVPEGNICVTAPNMGHAMYGAVTQIEESDRDFHTYPARRVPHVITSVDDGIKSLVETSKPLLAPYYKNSAISAKVLK